ncbi:hypothetical protein [Plantactinospora sp. B24E8]|uniref:lipopolysaccharide biosynthesis protein n=1 Tax=Plantactinospora sp. B24E8 TaxID=3153567 RepID=UPI00325E06B3
MTHLARSGRRTGRNREARRGPARTPTLVRRAVLSLTRERSLELAILLGPALLIVTSVLIARCVGPTGRGHLVILTTWAQVMGWTGGLSIDKALLARRAGAGRATLSDGAAGGLPSDRVPGGLPSDRVPGEPTGGGRLVLVGLGTMLSAGGVAAVLSIAVAHSLLDGWLFLVGMPVAVLGTVTFDVRATLLLLAGRWQRYAVLRLTQPVAYLCGVAVVVLLATWRPALAVPGFIVAFCASLWLPTLLVGGLLRRGRSAVPRPRRTAADRSRPWPLFRFALTYHVGSVLYLLGSRVDLLLMPIYFTAGEIGSYAVAASAGQLVGLLGSANLLRGLTGRRPAAAGPDRAGLALALTITAGVALSVGWLLPLAYGGAFVGAVPLARILCLRGFLVYLTQGLIGRLTASGLAWANATVNLTGVLVFLALFPFATTLTGYVLAAVTSSAAAWLYAWWLSRRHRRPTAAPAVPDGSAGTGPYVSAPARDDAPATSHRTDRPPWRPGPA